MTTTQPRLTTTTITRATLGPLSVEVEGDLLTFRDARTNNVIGSSNRKTFLRLMLSPLGYSTTATVGAPGDRHKVTMIVRTDLADIVVKRTPAGDWARPLGPRRRSTSPTRTSRPSCTPRWTAPTTRNRTP